jgi:hypothetical protein
MFRREPDRYMAWAISAGVAAGASAGAAAFAMLRTVRRRRVVETLPGELSGLEDAAVDALRRDSQVGACAIDVAAVAPGIIELTGSVPTHEVAQRAVRLLHRLQEVRTVISRLEAGSLEERLAQNRERLARGEPELLERRWYGVRVGTGQRRQSLATEPARPDDSVPRRTRELEVRQTDLGDSEPHPRGGDFDDRPPPL